MPKFNAKNLTKGFSSKKQLGKVRKINAWRFIVIAYYIMMWYCSFGLILGCVNCLIVGVLCGEAMEKGSMAHKRISGGETTDNSKHRVGRLVAERHLIERNALFFLGGGVGQALPIASREGFVVGLDSSHEYYIY